MIGHMGCVRPVFEVARGPRIPAPVNLQDIIVPTRVELCTLSLLL